MKIEDITPDLLGISHYPSDAMVAVLTADLEMRRHGTWGIHIVGELGTLWRVEHAGHVVEIAVAHDRSRAAWVVLRPDGDAWDEGETRKPVDDSPQGLAHLAGLALHEAEAMDEMQDQVAMDIRIEEAA